MLLLLPTDAKLFVIKSSTTVALGSSVVSDVEMFIGPLMVSWVNASTSVCVVELLSYRPVLEFSLVLTVLEERVSRSVDVDSD